MTTIERPFVVGIFKDEQRAKSAIDLLKDMGFGDDQIEIAMSREEQSFLRILDSLVNLGGSEDEIMYYELEFEAGRSFVLVIHDGRRGEVLNIMFLNGTRNHKYLNAGRHSSRNPSDASVSSKQGMIGQREISQDLSINRASSSYYREKTRQEEWEKLYTLLKNAGLEHLL